MASVDLIDSLQLKRFLEAGIDTIGKLLALDAQHLPSSMLLSGILPSQIDRWQAQAWWLLAIPTMTPRDARVLVGCGIVGCEQLLADPPDRTVGRIQRYLESPDGRRLGAELSRYDVTRINCWREAAHRAGSRGQLVRILGGTDIVPRHQEWSAVTAADSPPRQDSGGGPAPLPPGYELGRYFATVRSVATVPGRHYLPKPAGANDHRKVDGGPSSRWTAAEQAAHANTTATMAHRSNHDDPLPAPTLPNASANRRSDKPACKFYLSLHDPIEAAPSIGPKTAERFTAIGVETIEDFLRMSADSMAERIAYKRISGDVIRQWQHQCRLVLNIPNLRGHDAQLLVACGITEPDQVAAMSPRELYDRIAPFAETKEGIRIIRAGRKPDLSEIQDWVRWAQQGQVMQAA